MPKVPEGYRIKVGSFLSLPKIKLQKKGLLFWHTVDSIIPMPVDHRTVEDDIIYGASKLIAREQERVYRHKALAQAYAEYYDHAGTYESKAQDQNV